jgi:hypothetical protein
MPLAVFNAVHYGKLDVLIRFVFVFTVMQFSYSFQLFGIGRSDAYKEAQEYICADVAAHSLKAAELNDKEPSYYGLVKITPFSPGDHYEVVYINPLHLEENGMLGILTNAGLDGSNVLKIRTTNEKYIWKKYLPQNTGRRQS